MKEPWNGHLVPVSHYSGPLPYWDYFSSGSSGLIQRLAGRQAANESLSPSSEWCDGPSQPLTSVYFPGCGSRPQVFISFYGCAVASIARRSGGGALGRGHMERCGMQREGCMGTLAPDALSIHLPLLKALVAWVMAAEEG